MLRNAYLTRKPFSVKMLNPDEERFPCIFPETIAAQFISPLPINAVAISYDYLNYLHW